jgi:hypothetical protein
VGDSLEWVLPKNGLVFSSELASSLTHRGNDDEGRAPLAGPASGPHLVVAGRGGIFSL